MSSDYDYDVFVGEESTRASDIRTRGRIKGIYPLSYLLFSGIIVLVVTLQWKESLILLTYESLGLLSIVRSL